MLAKRRYALATWFGLILSACSAEPTQSGLGSTKAQIYLGDPVQDPDPYPQIQGYTCTGGCAQEGQPGEWCSATMVTNDWVLTADHCVSKERFSTGALGSTWNLNADRETRTYGVSTGHTAADVVAVAWHKATGGLRLYYSNQTVGKGSDSYIWGAGGSETVYLPAGRTMANLRDVAFAPTGKVYAWFSGSSCLRTASSTADQYTDLSQNPITFVPAAGKNCADIKAVGLDAATSHCYAYYSDGTRSEGTDANLGAYDVNGAVTAQYPPGTERTPATLAGIDFSSGNRLLAYFTSGRVTISTDSSRLQLQTIDDNPLYTLPIGSGTTPGGAGTTDGEIAGPANIVGIDAEKVAGHVFVWYDNGYVSSGTRDDVDAYRAPYSYDIGSRKYEYIRGMGISKSNTVYAWYGANESASTGERLWGTTSSLTNSSSFSLTSWSSSLGRTHELGDIVAMAIGTDPSNNDRVYVWFSDSTYRYGSSTNPDATGGGQWTTSPDYGTLDVADIAIAPGSGNNAITYYKSPAQKVVMGNQTRYSDNMIVSAPFDAAMLHLSNPMLIGGQSTGHRWGFYPDTDVSDGVYPDLSSGQLLLRCFGYGGSGSLTSALLNTGTYSLDPVDHFRVLTNAAGQNTTNGDSGGTCVVASGPSHAGDFPMITGVHQHPGGVEQRASSLTRWAFGRAVDRPTDNKTTVISCAGAECFTEPRPMTNNQFRLTTWAPPSCPSGYFLWDAKWYGIQSGDAVIIDGVGYTGTSSTIGLRPMSDPLPFGVYTNGSSQSDYLVVTFSCYDI